MQESITQESDDIDMVQSVFDVNYQTFNPVPDINYTHWVSSMGEKIMKSKKNQLESE